jgi:hypothetical protein
MKRLTVIFTLALAVGGAHAQRPGNHSIGQTRPQWQGYYNGHGVSPGYRYNAKSGWNTMTTPNGAWMHYRDGYQPMRPSNQRRRYYNYNNNYMYGGSYSDIMQQFMP